MSSRYVLILVLYALASFAGTLAIAEAVLMMAARRLLRAIRRFRPADGVFALLFLRSLPPAVALLLTCVSAVPGYLRGEPLGTHELPGVALVALAVLGLYAVVAPLARTGLIFMRTAIETNRWSRMLTGTPQKFSDVSVVEFTTEHPVMVASGIRRKVIYVSRPVAALLSRRELRAALRHEAAHCRQNHNLGKLLCGLMPQLLPVRSLNETLRETMEYAADDEACAVPGDALNLAAALLTLARESVACNAERLYTALAGPAFSASLARRVERLVAPPRPAKCASFLSFAFACSIAVCAVAAIGVLPGAQHAFREILELLVH